jgi:hypothetical protein
VSTEKETSRLNSRSPRLCCVRPSPEGSRI